MRVQVDAVRAILFNLRYELEHLYVDTRPELNAVMSSMEEAEEAIHRVLRDLETLGDVEYPNGEIPNHT